MPLVNITKTSGYMGKESISYRYLLERNDAYLYVSRYASFNKNFLTKSGASYYVTGIENCRAVLYFSFAKSSKAIINFCSKRRLKPQKEV